MFILRLSFVFSSSFLGIKSIKGILFSSPTPALKAFKTKFIYRVGEGPENILPLCVPCALHEIIKIISHRFTQIFPADRSADRQIFAHKEHADFR
jgi:hypothetical protein